MSRVRACALAVLAIAAQVAVARADIAPPAPTSPLAVAAHEPGRLKYRVYAGADGLRNLVVIALAQDSDGFLWLGTDDGVYRFDGERFTHYSVEDGLPSSLIFTLGVAPEGEVCVGTNGGVACWDGARFSQALARGVPPIRVRTMVSYAGSLWIGTDGAGLYVRNASGMFTPAPGWTGTATIHAMWADPAGLVVGNDATLAFTSGDGRWRALGDVGLGRERVDDVLRDPDGALWIRTPSRLWQLPAGAGQAVDRSVSDLRVPDSLPSGRNLLDAPHSMAIGAHGELLVGTDAGVAIRDGGRWHLLERPAGTSAAVARTLLVDRDGTLWIGSSGLVQLRGRGLIERADQTIGLVGDVVWSFLRDPDGTLWAGTSECLARQGATRWACVPGTEGRVVRSIVRAPDGGMYLGGSPADLLYIDPSGHTQSLEIPTPEPHHDDDHERGILSMTYGPDGDLWIATRAGLYRLPGGKPGPAVHVAVPGAAPYSRFTQLAVQGGQLWVTTNTSGLFVLDHATWRRFDLHDGLRSLDTKYLAPRADGRMCVTYDESLGLSCFRYAAGQLTELTDIVAQAGLTTGMAYFIGEDARRRLWVGTGDGVDVVTSERPLVSEHFDDSDGLAGNDSAATAFFVDRDQSLWLGATGGASHVLAQYYAGPNPPPRATLVDGRVGDQPLHKQGERWATLDVPHDRNALVLELAAGSLLEARRLEYKSRLVPLELEWSPTRQREVHYPSLLPGVYRFEVRARVDGGAWGPASLLTFNVHAAWWQTRWFYGLVGLAGVLAIAGGFAWRQRRVIRTRTQQLAEQSAASFRAVIDQMPDLISMYSGFDVVHINQASQRFLGLAPGAAGWDRGALIERVHPDDREPLGQLFARVRSLPPRHASEIVEIRMKTADDSWRVVEVWGVQVELGGVLTLISSGRDVTERKRMRAKLLVSDRMASLGTLAAGIAHEINNPLAYVSGNLEAMAEALAGDAPPTAAQRRELAAAIHDARDGAERVRRIVQGLRSFSRSEEEQRTALALPGVIEAALRLTSNVIRHRAELVRELGPVPMVTADDGRLTQVFINLLVNAAHAIPEGRSDANRITVRTRTDDQGRAVIEVEDTGHGIPSEVQSRVFDPFFTTKDVGEGTGLGLSICHGIISGLGGAISIESAIGDGTAGNTRSGTTVRVVLPAAPELPAAAPAPVAAPEARGEGAPRQRIMLVDDEPLIAQTMERLLRRDYDITLAMCGQDALDHVAGGLRFAAIVSDVMMPNMTGIELLERLQQLAPDQAQRMIFLSGGAFTAQTRDRLDQLGAPQLEKPVSAKDLRACVKQMAERVDQLTSLAG